MHRLSATGSVLAEAREKTGRNHARRRPSRNMMFGIEVYDSSSKSVNSVTTSFYELDSKGIGTAKVTYIYSEVEQCPRKWNSCSSHKDSRGASIALRKYAGVKSKVEHSASHPCLC